MKMKRHYIAPDVPQTSSMDGGLAALKCVLEGFDISVSQRRLQEVLQPAVVVTSINRLAESAAHFGLDVELTTAPIDHLLLPEAENVPAIVIARQPPNHPTHVLSTVEGTQPPNRPTTHPRFLVVWRRHGPFLQVMDPAIGLRWLPEQRLLDELDIQTRPISAQDWRDGAAANGFSNLLRHRLMNLKLADADAARLTDTALEDPSWISLAALDAATRAIDVSVRAGGVQSGTQAGEMIAQLFEQSRREMTRDGSVTPTKIPQSCWSVLPLTSPQPLSYEERGAGAPFPARSEILSEAEGKGGQGDRSEERLLARGVVFLRVRRPQPAPEVQASASVKEKRTLPRLPKVDIERDPQYRGERELVQALRADGLLTPTILAVGLALAAGAVALQALFLRGMMQIGQGLNAVERMGVLGVLLVFFGALVLLELPINTTLMRMGRRLETRLRISLLEKIPRLSSRYFVDRPIADLNRRAYALRELRDAPEIAAKYLRAWFQLILTAVCIVWLAPTNLPFVLFSFIFLFGVARLADPLWGVPIYRCFIHANTLNHFYLDALLGLLPARTHSAERSIRREHESALAELIRADRRLTQRFGLFFLLAAVAPALTTVAIIFNYIAHGGTANDLLLLTYWALNLPLLTEQQGAAMVQYFQHCRPAALMLSQVLDAPEETVSFRAEREISNGQLGDFSSQKPLLEMTPEPKSEAVAIRMDDISVRVGESTILANINLAIKPGEHVAIVGASGAGKSSMVGLLLGWHRPTTGRVWVDDAPLEGERLLALRQETAWVDTAVQLWNRSLLDNLRYGTLRSAIAPLGHTIEEADLFNVLATLPNGLQTLLGESGRLVSGGEGQRVRLGRALFRTGVRLVILDEPFRALDRGSRRALLAETRRHWQAATLVLVSHDVNDVQTFERVLVMEGGRIVEDGAPSALAAQPDSRYRRLLEGEKTAQQSLWGSTDWRRLWLGDGQLSETNGNGQHGTS